MTPVVSMQRTKCASHEGKDFRYDTLVTLSAGNFTSSYDIVDVYCPSKRGIRREIFVIGTRLTTITFETKKRNNTSTAKDGLDKYCQPSGPT